MTHRRNRAGDNLISRLERIRQNDPEVKCALDQINASRRRLSLKRRGDAQASQGNPEDEQLILNLSDASTHESVDTYQGDSHNNIESSSDSSDEEIEPELPSYDSDGESNVSDECSDEAGTHQQGTEVCTYVCK